MTRTRTLEFTAEGGLSVTVTVTAPDERSLRLPAIRSALVRHARLCPVGAAVTAEQPEPPRRIPYWKMVAAGVALPVAGLAGLTLTLWLAAASMGKGFPPVPADLRGLILWAYLLAGMFLCTALFLHIEWQSRRHARRCGLLAAEHAPAPAGGL